MAPCSGNNSPGVSLPGEVRPARAADAARVWLGGALGAALRHVLSVTVPGPVPLVTFGINVIGAFGLAILVSGSGRFPEPRRRRLRLVFGTGVLGGFTTYSALAVQTVDLARAGAVGWALVYALGTVAVGAAATVGGLALGGRSR